MRDLYPVMKKWMDEQKDFAIATVIKTWGSSPRPIGSSMIVSKDKEIAGSVSGGCVEGAVLKSALPLIESGEGKKLDYGVTDEEAWGVGLSCGGKIQVYAEKFVGFQQLEVWTALEQSIKENKACVLATELVDGKNKHFLIYPDETFAGTAPSEAVKDQAIKAYKERKNQVQQIGEQDYFFQVFPRKSQMIIIGAAHITVDLVSLANYYGFETIVIDPRGFFSQKTQFTTPPDQIHECYPIEILPDLELDAYSYAVVLSHDPKIDDNALQHLLRSEVAYIGALGSRRTHAKRITRLTEAGFNEAEIERIHAPIGLSINAKKPAEIALSIMGQIIEVQNQYL